MLHDNQFDPYAEWASHSNSLPLMLDEEILNKFEASATQEEESKKLKTFEARLAAELTEEDTLEVATEKIIKVALAIEYGVHFTRDAGFKRMAKSIARSIQQDAGLRKQALLIAEQFTTRSTEKHLLH